MGPLTHIPKIPLASQGSYKNMSASHHMAYLKFLGGKYWIEFDTNSAREQTNAADWRIVSLTQWIYRVEDKI